MLGIRAMNAQTLYPPLTYRERRTAQDRRLRRAHGVFCSLYKRQRVNPQRLEERTSPYYTDVYSLRTLATVVSITILCLVDSFLTLHILANGGQELNPVMAALLDFGNRAFIFGKLLITCTGLLVALVHINFKVLRICPMRCAFRTLLVFYCLLVGYELTIISLR